MPRRSRPGRDHRLSDRYSVQLVGSLTVGQASRLRRRRVEDVGVLLADLSVTGAALLGPADSPLAAVVPGSDLALTVADHSGTVRVRHAGRRGDWFQLGVEFTDLSPGLEQLIYDSVERIRDGGGDLATAWTTAR